MKEILFRKTIKLFNRNITFKKRTKNGYGRFGGGWQIELGFQIGTNSVVINLFVMSIRIDRIKKSQ